MTEVEKYQEQCKQSGQAMTQSYYNKQAPCQGNPAGVPTVPRDEAGNQLVKTEDVPYKYIEVRGADGKNHLAILTPHEVGNGPGEKYDLMEPGSHERATADVAMRVKEGDTNDPRKRVLNKIAPEAGRKRAHDDVFAAGTGEIPDKWKPF